MHILITGCRGQLGRALQAAYATRGDVTVTAWDIDEIDLAEPSAADQVASLGPNVVINAAAWTNVDGAESQPDAAYAVNMLGPKHLADGCVQCGAALVHVSTNEVFPGEPGKFYREYDQRSAVGVYARSKLAGEQAVLLRIDKLFLVRVAWLFGPGGNNFPAKIVAAADRLGSLRVVDDEFGNPTYAPDAAEAIAALIERNRFGVYHLVNDGWCNRYQFAQHVLKSCGRGHIPVTPIASDEWARPSKPPQHAVLVNQAAAALGITLRPWHAAVEAYCADGLATASP